MIAILAAAALLQTTSPAGISYEEASSLPAETLAVRALGDYGRQFVAVSRPDRVYDEREPSWAIRFFTQPDLSYDGLCHMRLLQLHFRGNAPGQPDPATTPGAWRTSRLSADDEPRFDEVFRPAAADPEAGPEQIEAACAGLEPKLEQGWFAADDYEIAARAVTFARLLLPLEREGKTPPLAMIVEPGGCDGGNPLVCQGNAATLLPRMRLSNLAFVKGRPCTAFDFRSKLCLLMHFPDPDNVMAGLTIIVYYEEIDDEPGLRILSARATAAIVQSQ